MSANQRDDGLVFNGGPICMDNVLIINWEITRFCNFNCSYCWPKENIPLMLNIDLFKVADFILNLDSEKYRIGLTGGEASLHPQILKIVSYLISQSKIKNKTLEIVLLTNLSKPIDFYLEYFSLNSNYPNVSLHLAPSFHRECISIDDFFEKIDCLYSTDYVVEEVSYMIHEEECINILNSIEDIILKYRFVIREIVGLTIDYSKINKLIVEKSEATKNKRYSVYYRNNEYVYDRTFDISGSFKGFVCGVFKHKIIIKSDGSILDCEFTTNQKILNVFMDDILDRIKNNEYRVCSAKECVCGDRIPKFNMFHFNKLKNINEQYILDNFKRIKE